MTGQRIRELIGRWGLMAARRSVDDYLARGPPVLRDCADLSADCLSAGGDLPVRSVGAGAGDPGRSWPDAAGVGYRGVLGYSRAGAGAVIFTQEDARSVVRESARCLWSLGALAADAGVGPPVRGLHASGGPPDCGVRCVLRASCGSTGTSAPSVILRRRARRASSGLHGTQLRVGAAVSRTSWTSSCSSMAGSTSARTPRNAQDAALPPDRPPARGTSGDGRAAGPRARRRPPLGAAVCHRTRILRFDTCDYSLDPVLVGRKSRSQGQRARGDRGRARYRRARVPPPAQLCASSHAHRARARPHAEDPTRAAPRPRAAPRRRGRGSLARAL